MKKSFIFLGLFIALICLVGAVSGATETLTVVYDTSETHPFSMTSGGHTYITVKAPDNTYHYYAPAPVDDLLTASLSGGTWQTVQKLGQYDSDGNPTSSSDGYIITSTSAYINTLYYPNINTQLNAKVQLTSDIGTEEYLNSFAGSQTSSNTNAYKIYALANKKQGSNPYLFRVSSISYSIYDYSTDLVVIYGSSSSITYTKNGVSSSYTPFTTPTSFTSSYSMYLFANNVAGTASNNANYLRMYALKLTDNSGVMRDYIPIRIGEQSNGEYALYDKQLSNSVIYKNAGTGSFSGGGTPSALTYPHTIPNTPSISAISVTSSSPAPVGSTVQVSATLSNINEAGTVQFATSTNGNTWTNVGNAVSIASGATTATQTFTGSSTAGLYYVKAILTVGSTTYDSHTSGVSDGQVRLVTTPTLGDISISPATIGKLNTAYTLTLSETVTDMGGGAYIIYELETSTDGSTWSYVSGGSQYTSAISRTVTITDTAETTHYYRYIVSTISGFPASTTAYSPNTVSFQTFAQPATPTAEINPTTITINTATEVTLTASNVPTAPAGNTYYYQWYYGSSSTPSAGDTAITEQETTLTNPATWQATFAQTGTKYVYLKITDAAGNDPVYSPRQTLTISNYAPPTITMVSRQTSSPALTGSDVKVKVIATSYEGTTTHLTYKWYYAVSSASPEWAEISGQTTNILTTQFSTEGTYMLKCVVTDTSISMSTDSYTAGKYATVQIVPQPSISAVAVNPYVLDLSVSTTVQLSASVTNPSGVYSLVWQQSTDGGEWSNTPLTLDHGTVTVSSAGTYLYRLQVTPIVGSVITSENTHSVVAGTLPVISIVSPPNNSQYGVGETIQINATGTGVTAIQWSFGDGVKASGNTNTLTPWVQYTGIGIHTITLTAANSFGNKTASIQIIVSSAKRPLATSTPAPIKDANMVYEWMENFNPQSAEDQSPDVMGIFKGLTAPFTNVMGQWCYLALFGIPYLLIWIRTRNTIIPSIIGILFGAWLWVMLPGSAMAAAVCILILSVSGGIFGIYLSRRQRE